MFVAYFVDNRRVVYEIGHSMALASFEKDILFRRWGAIHGGVYVPETATTPANPYLIDVPERDIVTPSGRRLTLVNPAYMTRQIFELAREMKDSPQGHITSLNPIRPENSPDQWEANALKLLESGVKEVIDEMTVDRKSYLRIMRPLTTEKPCLRCHAAQGYKEGNQRGGISVTVPLTPIQKTLHGQMLLVGITFLFIWLVGLGFILFGARKIARTMTMLREEQNRLHESEESYRKQFADNTSIMLLIDPSGGEILDANISALKFYGYSRDTLLSMKIQEINLLPPPNISELMNSVTPLHGKRFEFQHRLADGSKRDVEVSSSNIQFGQKQILHSIIFDITERKKAEEAMGELKAKLQKQNDELLTNEAVLREKNEALIAADEMLRQAHQVARMGHWELDFTSGKLTWSDKVFEMLEIRSGSFTPTYEAFIELVHPEDRDKVNTTFIKSVRNRKTYEIEHRMLMKDGRIKWISEIGHHEYDTTGNPSRSIGTGQDITERKQAEEERHLLEQQFHQAQKLESLGVLASGIAHDFNNILTVILGHCYMAREFYDSSNDYRDTFQHIETAGNRAADLCRQMLTYAGKSPKLPSRINLGLLVNEVARMLEAAIKKNVVIELDVKRDVPEINGDSGQIQQIIMNLIINAADAIGNNNGCIRVGLTQTIVETDQKATDTFGTIIQQGRYACLTVNDTGCGMDEQTQQRIFEPFFTTKFTGRGLGMSAIRGIIKAHSGMLQLSSKPGFGTTFTVCFPLPVSAGDAAASLLEPVQNFQSGGTILLVDDEKTLLAMAEAMLLALGFSVLTATNGNEAVEIFYERGEAIDLILMDLVMPVMGGIEAYNEIRKINQTMPVIICSGFGAEAVQDVTGSDPYADFVAKPYKPQLLQDAIITLMKGALYHSPV